MSKVLFEITEECLETGLRGYPCGYCTTSEVDPQKGLSYAGYPIHEVAHLDPINVIYLLYYGKKGSSKEIESFSQDLIKRSKCNPDFLAAIEKLPATMNPMHLFCMALLMASQFEGKQDYQEDALNLIAKVPQIVAAVINHHGGWKNNPSKPELGYIENFIQMLGFPKKDLDIPHLTEVFKLFDVLHFDHDGGNLSTFVGKAVASGLEDIFGSMNAAMAALHGPRHGRANQDSLDFIQGVYKEVGKNASSEQIANLIRKKLAAKELVFGFGHAVLRIEDPRASILYEVAKKYYPDHDLVKTALLMREAVPFVLKENPKISNPYPNVDAISGTLLIAAGFPYPQYYPVLFGLSRTVGISIQILYERLQARGGKGTPIVRPTYFYKDRFQ